MITYHHHRPHLSQLSLYNNGAVCFELVSFACGDRENMCSLSYRCHHIGSMTHNSLFRDRCAVQDWVTKHCDIWWPRLGSSFFVLEYFHTVAKYVGIGHGLAPGAVVCHVTMGEWGRNNGKRCVFWYVLMSLHVAGLLRGGTSYEILGNT